MSLSQSREAVRLPALTFNGLLFTPVRAATELSLILTCKRIMDGAELRKTNEFHLDPAKFTVSCKSGETYQHISFSCILSVSTRAGS